MSDVELDPALQAAQDTFMAAEEARRNALQRLGFHQLTDLFIYHEKQVADLALMEQMALANMSEEERAAVLAARKPTDKDSEERLALEAEEDFFGRRVILLEEAEATRRLQLAFSALDLAISIDEAFRPCIRKYYDYAWGTINYSVMPLPPSALDRIDRNPERHLPSFMWQEQRQSQAWFQALLDNEHEEKVGSTLETLAIAPPKPEPKQAPLALENNEPERLRITA